MPTFSTPQIIPAGTAFTETLLISTLAQPPVGVVERLLTLQGEVTVSATSAANNTFEAGAIGIHAPMGIRHLIWIDGGKVTVTMTGKGTAYGYYSAAFDTPNFFNSGTFNVASTDRAVGVQFWALESYWTNTGVIEVTGRLAKGVVALAPHANGLNNGLIKVFATERAIGVDLDSHVAALNNNGQIIVSDTTAFSDDDNYSNDSIALRLRVDNLYKGYGEFYNRGLIEGEVAVLFDIYTDDAAELIGWRGFHNEANGVIKGMVVGSRATDVIENAGLIDGEIRFGAGRDTYSTQVLANGMHGRVTGMVSGGEGDDHLFGGPAFDYLHGNQGDDEVRGGGGHDWIVGGQGADRIFGDDGNDVVTANLGNDTAEGGAGDDWVRGGQGNDSVSGGAGADFLAGDRGDDTITGGAGSDRFHSFADAGFDYIVDFNRAEGDALNLLSGSTYTVAQVGADVVVSLTGGAKVVLLGVSLGSLSGDWITAG